MRVNEEYRIAPEGYPFMVLGFLLMVGCYFLHWVALIPSGLLFIWVVWFFRNPKRVVPLDPKNIICPADGKVIQIREVEEGRFLHQKVRKISIFMSPFNVHVNRVPVEGVIKKVAYNKGKYFAAYAEKASLDNEQNALVVEDKKGRQICFIQIAGFLARRIVSYAKEGDSFKQGEIFGLIRFGSRMDVYMPLEAEVKVQMDQMVQSGATILAEYPDS